jgi:hypothetical protein
MWMDEKYRAFDVQGLNNICNRELNYTNTTHLSLCSGVIMESVEGKSIR